jgi:hypothetical protein
VSLRVEERKCTYIYLCNNITQRMYRAVTRSLRRASTATTRSGALVTPVALDSDTQESIIVSFLRDSDVNMIVHHHKAGEKARYVMSAVERSGLSREDVFVAADVRCSESHEVKSIEDIVLSIGSDMSVGSLDMIMIDPVPYIAAAGFNKEDVKSRQEEVINAMRDLSSDVTRFIGLSFRSTPEMDENTDQMITALINMANTKLDSDRFVSISRAASSTMISQPDKRLWQISYDSLRPRISFESEDSVPFVFEGGNDVASFEMSPLENALNGLIHLETFVLAAIDEKRGIIRERKEEEENDVPEVVSKMEIPDDIEARNVAWGHTLARNLAGIGSLHEWQYVRHSMIEPAMKDSIRSLNETDCDASKEWVKLYQARMSTMNSAMEEYMKHRDADFAASVLSELKTMDSSSSSSSSYENISCLEEVSLRHLLSSGFDTVVLPSSLRPNLDISSLVRNVIQQEEGFHLNEEFKIGARVRNMSGGDRNSSGVAAA